MAGKEGKVILPVFAAGLLAGVFFLNVVLNKVGITITLFDKISLQSLLQKDIRNTAYLCYLIRIRLFPAILLTVLGATRFRRPAAVCFLLWTGFLGGILFSAASVSMGVRGIILCIMSNVPQIVIYVTGYIAILTSFLTSGRETVKIEKTVLFYLAICIGIGVEWYMNPIVVKFILNYI